MSPADTPIKVCSRASLLIGGDAIQSFNDGTAEAAVSASMYEDIARAGLTNTRWRFSSNQAVLNRLTNEPTGRWDAAYQMPSTSIMTSAITVQDMPIKYDTYGTKIYCDASPADEVVADYIFRSDESVWPPYFTIVVEYMMASVLAISVARDSSLGQLMEAKTDYFMRLARARDSQSQTTRKLNTSRFITERRS